MWKGYVVLNNGCLVTICKNTMNEALQCIAVNYHFRAKHIYVFEVEETEAGKS